MISNFRKKVVTAGVLGLLALPLAVLPQKVGAQTPDEGLNLNYNQDQHLGQNQMLVQSNQLSPQRFFTRTGETTVVKTNRVNSTIVLNQNFLSRQRFFPRRFALLREVNARQVILVDRNNTQNRITLTNFLTGFRSINVNRVFVLVDRGFFENVSDLINVDQGINIRVNTGDNTVSFNTIAGDLTTGDVDISVF